MLPTANHVAWAIVAACRLTGEDPLAVAEQRTPKSRARHYALQALRSVFPKASRESMAFRVGCPGNTRHYATNSTNGMALFVGGPHKGGRKHRFWNEDIFARVIAAIHAVGLGSEIADVPEEEPGLDAYAPRAIIKLSARTDSIVEPTRPAAAPGKRKLEDMLRSAVENTQRMTPPPEDQP